jgi:dienelactone hydrolase
MVDQNFGQGNVSARVYYPTSLLSEGPFPLVNFMHGWFGRPSNYDVLCLHIASHGYVVASTAGTSGLFPDTVSYARDSRAILHEVTDASADPQSWLYGLVEAAGDWSSIGHSMGGATLGHMVAIEPRVSLVIGLQSAGVPSTRTAAMAAYPGAALWIAGSEDSTVSASGVYSDFSKFTSSARNAYMLVDGMGHSGPTDSGSNSDTMTRTMQMDVHKRAVLVALNAEMKDHDADYEWLVGDGVAYAAPWSYEPVFRKPVLWGGEQPTALGIEMGVIGPTATQTLVYGSLARVGDNIDAALSTVILNAVISTEGTMSWSQWLPPQYSGMTVYAQAVALGGRHSKSKVLDILVP